jgi:protein gp37
VSGTSGIQWTEATWNCITGCTPISAGCDNCYAARETSGRLSSNPRYNGLAVNGAFTGEVRCHEDLLDRPLTWGSGRRVFVNSMSDCFHAAVPTDFLARMWAVMGIGHRHQYQVLTKRPRAAARVLSSYGFQARVLYHTDNHPQADASIWADTYPLPNVWVGASVEHAKTLGRITALRDVPAALRFLSIEPLIGPLPDLRPHLDGIDWVIVGGESGARARPMDPQWAMDILDACRATGTAFFWKQAGAVLARAWGMTDRAGHALDEVPVQALRVRDYPALVTA